MRVLGKRSVASFVAVLVNVGIYMLAVALVLTVVLTAALPFMTAAGGQTDLPVSFSVDAATLATIAPAIDGSSARIERARGSLILPVADPLTLVGPFLFVVVAMGVVLWVLVQLRAVFRTLAEGQPFVAANARRIRWIAWGVIAGEAARAIIVYSSNRFAATHFTANGLTFDTRPDLNLFTIISGLVILVISEVFRAGTALDEEQSLTV
jgi:hypothetical protein